MRDEQVSVRPARLEEVEALARIGFAAWLESDIAAMDAGRADRDALFREFQAFCLESHDAICVAHLVDQPVGWGARVIQGNYISDLWVLQSMRGRGAGSALIARLEADIRKAGYARAELEVVQDNARALRFYQARGYEIIWRGERFDEALGYAVPRLRLVKPLS